MDWVVGVIVVVVIVAAVVFAVGRLLVDQGFWK